jgi:hypothetical protein
MIEDNKDKDDLALALIVEQDFGSTQDVVQGFI